MRESSLHRQIREDAKPYKSPRASKEEDGKFGEDPLPPRNEQDEPTQVQTRLAPPLTTLFMTNLPFGATKYMIRSFLSDVAKIVEVQIKRNGYDTLFFHFGSPLYDTL